MQVKIVDSRPWRDENENLIGTIYTVAYEDENGTEFVEVNVEGDDNSLANHLGVASSVDTSGDTPTFTKIDDDSVERLKLRQSTPPEAYAAFIRLYLEWMEMSEDEQVEYARKNVVYAAKNHKKYANQSVVPLRKSGDEMYGEEFDGYVSEAWASFGERFTDVDAFAVYLEKNYERCSNFPMSGDMLRRAAQNMMRRTRKDQIASSQTYSFEYEKQDNDGDGITLANTLFDETADVEITVIRKEEAATYDDFVQQIRAQINNPVRKQIFDRLTGHPKCKQKEIAEELGISEAAVSKHIKKIREFLKGIQFN